MAHVFVLIEGKRDWFELFLNDLDKRRYIYKMNNGGLGWIQPNPREIKLFDISVPEQCIPALMSDLAPFAKDTSRLRGIANAIAGSLRTVTGLHSIYDLPPRLSLKAKLKNIVLRMLGLKKKETVSEYKSSGEIRTRWINKIPIGWMEDRRDPKTMDKNNPNTWVPNYPYGGELV